MRRRSTCRTFLSRDVSRVTAGAVGGATCGAPLTPGTSSGSAGTDRRARSAIALLPSRACGLVLDRVADVFLDGGKLGDHPLDGIAIDAGKRGVHQFLAEVAKAFQQGPGLGGQIKPLGAAVVRIRPALDKAAVAQPVEEPGQRDRLQVEHFGEFKLFETLEPVEPDEDDPLGARNAELARFMIRIGAEHPSYIIECKGEFSIKRSRKHGYLPESMQA